MEHAGTPSSNTHKHAQHTRLQEEDARQQEAARLAFIAEVEEWSQGEMEAVAADAEARVAGARREAAAL